MSPRILSGNVTTELCYSSTNNSVFDKTSDNNSSAGFFMSLEMSVILPTNLGSFALAELLFNFFAPKLYLTC